LSRSTIAVPNLDNMSYRQAIDQINDAYFNVGAVTFDTSVHNYIDTLNAVVWKQNPAYYEKSRSTMGGKINIWLTINAAEISLIDSVKNDIPN
jgi:hypothetical protein